MLRAAVLTLLALAGAAVASCGDDSPVAPVPTPSAVDEEYLIVLCTGLDRFSAALIGEETEEDIRQVIIDYIAELEAAEPPADIRSFHTDFIEYLSESQENPRDLVLLPRPRPGDAARARLAAAERNIEECDELAFFTNVDDDFER